MCLRPWQTCTVPLKAFHPSHVPHHDVPCPEVPAGAAESGQGVGAVGRAGQTGLPGPAGGADRVCVLTIVFNFLCVYFLFVVELLGFMSFPPMTRGE